MAKQCKECRFWSFIEDHEEETCSDVGSCHRHAPYPYRNYNDFAVVEWPVTCSFDWCGEYEPKPPDEELDQKKGD